MKLEELLGARCHESSNQSSHVELVDAYSIKSSDRKQVINFEMAIKDKMKKKLEELLGSKQ